MYFLSFFPLWFSVIFIDTLSLIKNDKHICTEIISITVIFICLVFSLSVLLLKLNKKPNNIFYIKKAREEKIITAEFLSVFIIPLLAFDFTKWDSTFLFCWFFFIFGFICVRHNYFCTNVILELFKYKIYDCELIDDYKNEIQVKVISKRNLNYIDQDDIKIDAINNDYFVDHGCRGSCN